MCASLSDVRAGLMPHCIPLLSQSPLWHTYSCSRLHLCIEGEMELPVRGALNRDVHRRRS